MRLCAEEERTARALGELFIPAGMDGRRVRVGPIIHHAIGPCWVCWTRRMSQHDPFWRERRRIHDAYDAQSELGPKGFLNAHALLTAAWLAEIIERVRTGAAVDFGRVQEFDVLKRSVHSHQVIRSHGCLRCAPRVTAGGARDGMARMLCRIQRSA
jgi:bacteriocin biosynthesis cyclodehydratase domain-containing protein